MSVYTSFADRVNHAARCIVNNGPYTRNFDTCFEMGDGTEVCLALIKRSAKNPRLLAAMRSSNGLSYQHLVDEFGKF